MISAVGTPGKLYFRFKLQEAIDHFDIARFLEHLLRHVPGKLVVFLDGARQHRGPGIEGVLERHPRLRLEFLPPYGFDYNPDEGVWDHLKWTQLRNFTPHDTGEQVGALRKGLRGDPGEAGIDRIVLPEVEAAPEGRGTIAQESWGSLA